MLRRVGIASEGKCPEDPHGVDRQVALFPQDAAALVRRGCDVAVEAGAGAGMGFSDQDYKQVGVRVQGPGDIYKDKDLVVKIKGPQNENIEAIDPGAALFCMAHLPMYPNRLQLLTKRQVNVFAMEGVAERFELNRSELASKYFAKTVFDNFLKEKVVTDRHVVVLGYSAETDGILRYFGRKQMASLTVLPGLHGTDWLNHIPAGAVVVSDGAPGSTPFEMALAARQRGHTVAQFRAESITSDNLEEMTNYLYPEQKFPEFGKRSIQCLHETGRTGAQFGLAQLRNVALNGEMNIGPVVVLGYGNVAMGAIDQCLREGQTVKILGRHNTNPARIDSWLRDAKLVINGAFIPDERAGIDFVITNRHVDRVMQSGSVLIDLIGGSPSDRSPVEPVDTCTFLGEPSFVRSGVQIASVFAWPNFYRSKETNQTYSGQIAGVLTREGGLIDGLQSLEAGIQRAQVLGPFERDYGNRDEVRGVTHARGS